MHKKTLLLLRKVALIALTLAIPTVLLLFLASKHLAIIFILSAVIGLNVSGTLSKKPKITIALALILAGLFTVASATGQNPIILPLLVALAGSMLIATNRLSAGLFGFTPAYVAVVAFLTNSTPPYLVFLLALVGFSFSFALTRILKIASTPKPMTSRESMDYGILFAVAGALSTWICLHLNIPHSYWLILSVILVLRPQHTATFAVMHKRIVATVTGGLIATVMLALPHSIIVALTAIMFVLFLYSFIATKNYFWQITLITALLLIILSSSNISTEHSLALERIIMTLIGAFMSAILYTVGLLIIKVKRHRSTPTNPTV